MAKKTTSDNNQQKVRDAISKAGVELLRKEPFFAHILANVSRSFGDDVETMAVSYTDKGFFLWVNDDFALKKLNDKERIAVLKHEMLHLVLKHVFRGPGSDPELENLAADLVVNQYVAPWPLPDGAILLSTFPDLNLLPDQTMEWYLYKLKKLRNNDAQEQFPESYHALESIIQSNNQRGQHNLWGSHNSKNNSNSGDLSDAAIEATLKNIVAQALTKVKSDQWGTIPSSLRRTIESIVAPAKLPWKKLLRIFCQSCGKTKIVNTRNKESIRFPGNPGIRIKRLQHIAVAIDTSGSIDECILNKFWTEIIGIYKTGAKVTILECDAKVQRTWELKNNMETPKLHGGGGTNFDPVFEWLNENRHSGLGGCIYLTDGVAPKPTIKPFCKILWVVYRSKSDNEHLVPGRVIELD